MKSCSLLYVVVFFGLSIHCNSQSAVVTSGGDALSSAGSVAYSIGEPIYRDFAATAGNINEGVQQPHFLIVTSNESYDVAAWNANVFPNPVSEVLKVQVDPYTGEELHYELISLQGQLILRGSISAAETDIPLRDLAAGNYLLKLGGDHRQTFKIVVSH